MLNDEQKQTIKQALSEGLAEQMGWTGELDADELAEAVIKRLEASSLVERTEVGR